MQILLTFDGAKVTGADKDYPASCRVRTVDNGLRRRSEVIHWKGRPYMPDTFPLGIHRITAVEWVEYDRDLYWPVKIRTDALNKVWYWRLKNGQYDFAEDICIDGGYLIHHARHVDSEGVMRVSGTTHGCIAIADPEKMKELGRWVEARMQEGNDLFLEVRVS